MVSPPQLLLPVAEPSACAQQEPIIVGSFASLVLAPVIELIVARLTTRSPSYDAQSCVVATSGTPARKVTVRIALPFSHSSLPLFPLIRAAAEFGHLAQTVSFGERWLPDHDGFAGELHLVLTGVASATLGPVLNAWRPTFPALCMHVVTSRRGDSNV